MVSVKVLLCPPYGDHTGHVLTVAFYNLTLSINCYLAFAQWCAKVSISFSGLSAHALFFEEHLSALRFLSILLFMTWLSWHLFCILTPASADYILWTLLSAWMTQVGRLLHCAGRANKAGHRCFKFHPVPEESAKIRSIYGHAARLSSHFLADSCLVLITAVKCHSRKHFLTSFEMLIRESN